MKFIEVLIDRISQNPDKEAIIWNDIICNYRFLNEQITHFYNYLEKNNIKQGSVVTIKGDFTPNTIAIFLALIAKNCIIVPMISSVKNEEKLLEISESEYLIEINEKENPTICYLKSTSNKNEFYKLIEKSGNPGLVLFSSGTSGEPKCAVHDFSKLLMKFHEKKSNFRTLNFLLFDHWGGLNTMLHSLSNISVIISTKDRSPRNICRLIEKYKVELLPASPTFLNMLILSEAHSDFDLSSLQIISYGTEPMLTTTLQRLKTIFPSVKLLQTYGLIELGVLKSKSEHDESLWVKLGGTGYELRVIDGLLEIKAESAMLGYLNAPSPFTEDGWFKTGDAVEVQGDYLKILGRKSELINVGGEKVYPTEVETVIQDIPNVAEVTVFGEKNPIMGMIVVAKIRLLEEEDKRNFSSKLKTYCRSRLENYKIPVKIIITNEVQYGDRLKKTRK